MSVFEQVMGWGSWSVTLNPAAPASIWEVLDPSPEAVKVGGFGHVLITPTHVDPNAVGDPGLLGMSRYTGIYRGTSSRNTLSGVGLAAWLGDEDDKGDVYETVQTGGAGSFANWISDLLPASITSGSITAIAGTLLESMVYMSPRAALARVMDYFGGVYRVNPDGTFDAGIEADLFSTTPEVILIWRGSGPDTYLHGFRAATIELARDLDDYTTRLVLIGAPTVAGTPSAPINGIAIGEADGPATPYQDLHGNPVIMKRVLSAPDVGADAVDALAAAQLGRFDSVRRSYNLSTNEWGVAVLKHGGKRVEPGDHIWVYDPRPDAKLRDTTNQVQYQGQVLAPIKMRLESMTWPVQEGMGVYFRYWDTSTPVTVDLTDHVMWETGPSTLQVGASSRKLVTDTTASVVQGRIATPEWATWTPSYSNLTVGNGTVVARYARIGNTVVARWSFLLGSTSAVGTAPVVSLPVNTSASGYTTAHSLGRSAFLDAGTNTYYGDLRWTAVSQVEPILLLTSGTYGSVATVSATVPFTWTTGDIMSWSAIYETA